MIALFLVCILAIPIFAIPASATANDRYEVPYVDLFDIGWWWVDGEASTDFTLEAGQSGTFDTSTWITTVEIAYASSSASITINGSSYTGTATEASGVYAVKAAISTNTGLTIGTTSGLTLLTCKARLKGTAYTHPTFDLSGYIGNETVSGTGLSEYQYSMEDDMPHTVYLKLFFSGDQLYSSSFLDIDIATSEFYLTGIEITNGTRALPYTTYSTVYDISNPVMNDNIDIYFDSTMKLTIDTSSTFISAYGVTVKLYGNLLTELEGSALFNLSIDNIAACPDLSAPNPQANLLVKIWNSLTTGFNNVTLAISSLLNESVGWFSDIYDNITITREYILNYLAELFSGEDAGDPDDFNSDVDQQETQFQEMVDTMETAPTVDVDEALGMLDSLDSIQQSSTDSFYLSLVSSLMSLGFLPYVYMFCGLLCILGYLLYGKR